jgi:lipopolysaccharide-binding protein
MEIGISMGMKSQNGSLKLFVLESGCYMEDLDITLNGGASWFYQVYVILNLVSIFIFSVFINQWIA